MRCCARTKTGCNEFVSLHTSLGGFIHQPHVRQKKLSVQKSKVQNLPRQNTITRDNPRLLKAVHALAAPLMILIDAHLQNCGKGMMAWPAVVSEHDVLINSWAKLVNLREIPYKFTCDRVATRHEKT